ncbi:MAG: hypothetical protein Q9187_007062 [Circinaria calcarea]
MAAPLSLELPPLSARRTETVNYVRSILESSNYQPAEARDIAEKLKETRFRVLVLYTLEECQDTFGQKPGRTIYYEIHSHPELRPNQVHLDDWRWEALDYWIFGGVGVLSDAIAVTYLWYLPPPDKAFPTFWWILAAIFIGFWAVRGGVYFLRYWFTRR